MNLYLIRHGRAQRADEDPQAHPYPHDPLSPRGEEQAHQLAQRLKKAQIDALLVSDIARALQTAGIVSRYINVPITVVPMFAEWSVPSSVLGKRPDEYSAEYLKFRQERFIDPDARFEDGESVNDLLKRVKSAREYIIERFVDRNLAVITHYNFIRLFALNELVGEHLDASRLFYASFGLEIGNASISQFIYNTAIKRFIIVSLNDFRHLHQE